MLEAQALSIHVASSSSLFDRPDFLASLDAQTKRAYQVIFVDLGLGRANAVSEFDIVRPDVVRLRVFRNVGVVRGQNQAIALALSRWPRETWSERFVVLSRPEVAFDRRACEVFVEAFTADPTLMVAGPKVFWADAVAQTEGDWIELACSDQLYAAGIGLTRHRTLSFIGQGSQDMGQFDAGEGVTFLSDACVVIRASAFESLALADGVWLDPHLPPFFAVMDLCWRAAWQGMRPRLLPDARVWFAPQDQPRHKRRGWRDVYVPSGMRSRTDDIGLRLVHMPWVFWSYLRYRVSHFFFGRFWKERLKLEVGAVESLAGLKFTRRPDRAVPLAERRRWFLP
jgi:GT2 family glycosyltransferase